MTKQTFEFDSELEVNRLGFGAMQLPGTGVWGPSTDEENAVAVVKAVLNSDVNFIDTADSYGPFYANLYIKAALKDYQGPHKLIASKVGFTRPGPNQWSVVGDPDYLRQQVELNLRTLGLDSIDLMQLHRVDPRFPIEEQVGVLADMQKEGKIRHIGLSQVTVEQIKRAQAVAKIASVQNRYNLIERDDEDVLQYAEENHMAFIPWFPLATGRLAQEEHGILSQIANNHLATPSQIALAWLLQKSDVILPIPGTSNIQHFESNIQAAYITLSDAEFNALEQL
ncbi:aldo/keto reductase [Pediococcus pentosaceus]|jgi:aryl-alcohol dehydrogenase-like predicted oxidoreductase|uniref:Aldo/keto reductase n=1 Tax=Pediococcus pentosaceus TaxID=1255 RepID=A0ABD7X8E8_PEDPE|nr:MULTISPECIES: aldo/keto reductase [Pediococcus]ASC08712.1 putative oxidoreductase [Pediococcus pentosaceus]AVL01300.1 aldo/keto reductase [Pediococcus pentosaceus]AXR43258.1 aldo/keto reductase [Pediococcus pentosaceus]KAF0349606.1 aldo/keto reductase [Pediococcus pentosaceus]KAF0395601.1 aldo/keto reductase [Pediococcus pentosaceus]